MAVLPYITPLRRCRILLREFPRRVRAQCRGGFGIGGGALMVPVLIIFMKIDPHVAIGTSLAIIVPIALSGAVRHFTFQNVDISIVLPAALGGIVGAVIGATLIEGIPAVYAKKGLALFLVYVAIRLWFSK